MITYLQSYNIVNSKKLKPEELQKQQTTLSAMIKSNTNTLHKVHMESYAEVYLDDEEVGKIDNRSNTESEKQLNINTTFKLLHSIKDYPT
ncbi:9515_t:CDS:2 [Cetraspora pellucida]|uniref:9515_t:CDS:1 n=1 Tax=Cetraspora pellucida TaxID=1433469 RepID=A0A9N9H962_9GLOM|nr:9515_t:CDS:2 [Cetraspora pellucida]